MQLRLTEVAKRIFSFASSNISCSYGPLASRLASLRAYARRLDQTDQAYALLGEVLTADADIVSDEVLDLPMLSDQVTEIYQSITSDTYELIDKCLCDVSNILDNVSAESAPGDVTIVDGDGVSYKLTRQLNDTTNKYEWYFKVYDGEGAVTLIPFITTIMHDGVINCKINNVVSSMNGALYTKTITSWLNSLSVTATINSITNSVINLCVKGKANVTSIYSSVSSFTTSKITSVKKWANTMIAIFNEGGLSGIVNYILRDLHAVGYGLFDNNGAMAFTNNENLVPKEFIGSMLSTIATTVGTMLLAFAGVVGKIIGAALSVAGGIISWFTKTAWGQYNSETKAGLVDTSDDGDVTVIPEAPYAMCQFDFQVVNDDEIQAMLEQNSGIVIFDVPGGFLHVGPSSISGHLRMEFHPHAFWTFVDIPSDFFIATPQGQGDGHAAYFAVPRTDLNVNAIINKWNGGFDVGADYSMTNNWSSEGAQVFSDSSDSKLRRVIVRNTGLFLLFLSALNYNYNPSAKYFLPISKAVGSYPHFAYQLSEPAEPIGWHGGTYRDFTAWAFIPLAGSISPKQGDDGSDASTVSPTVPTWTKIGNAFTSINNTATASAGSVVGVSFVGNNVIANYDISGGIWYPLYGSGFIVANHSDLGSPQGFDLMDGCDSAISYGRFIGDADFVTTSISSGVYTPKYNRETYWLWVGAMAAVTVVAAGVTVIASLKIRKAIKLKRASNTAKVEAAWANLTKYPQSSEAQTAYYKAAKRANLWSKVIGGTTFDTSNYWSGGSDDSEPTSGKLMNYIAGENSDESEQDITTQNFNKLDVIRNLIRPDPVDPETVS